jgi:membrane protease subunit (stomatin/prohibitin family)
MCWCWCVAVNRTSLVQIHQNLVSTAKARIHETIKCAECRKSRCVFSKGRLRWTNSFGNFSTGVCSPVAWKLLFPWPNAWPNPALTLSHEWRKFISAVRGSILCITTVTTGTTVTTVCHRCHCSHCPYCHLSLLSLSRLSPAPSKQIWHTQITLQMTSSKD